MPGGYGNIGGVFQDQGRVIDLKPDLVAGDTTHRVGNLDRVLPLVILQYFLEDHTCAGLTGQFLSVPVPLVCKWRSSVGLNLETHPSAGIGRHALGLLCDHGGHIHHVKKGLPAFHGSGCVGDPQCVIRLVLFLNICQFQQRDVLALQGDLVPEPLIFEGLGATDLRTE